LISGPRNWLILCKVIDNFGDVGVTWRLARQLAVEHHAQVEFWVDDLARAKSIGVESKSYGQGDVTVREWNTLLACDPSHCFGRTGLHVVEAVIAAFACETPDALVAQMQLSQNKNNHSVLWINLEYLSAESWIEGSHLLSSPKHGLAETFYFPGWTEASGGLIRESSMQAPPQKSRKARERLLEQLQLHLLLDGQTQALLEAPWVSLFSYPHAPVAELIQLLREHGTPTLVLVPQGVASKALARLALFAHAQAPADNGQDCAWFQLGPITVARIPIVTQEEFDQLLAQCDLNLVRGEDSLVRALWANAPFLWHIYPQQDGAHEVKLDAFLDRVLSPPNQASSPSRTLMDWWNGRIDKLPAQAQQFLIDALVMRRDESAWAQEAKHLRLRIASQTDLLTRLLNFATLKASQAV
jgi:uncharacterized repeat protein (TIGR03837 family)